MSLDQVANLGFFRLPLRPGQMVGNEVLTTMPSEGSDD